MSAGSGGISRRQRDEIIRRAKAGERPRAIAARLHLPPAAVNHLVSMARRCGEAIPYFYARFGVRSEQPADRLVGVRKYPVTADIAARTRAALDAAAARRGWSVDFLAGELLTTLVEDSLIDAVLDDGFAPEKPSRAAKGRAA